VDPEMLVESLYSSVFNSVYELTDGWIVPLAFVVWVAGLSRICVSTTKEPS